MNFIEAQEALKVKIAALRNDLNFYPNSLPDEFTSPYIIIEEASSKTINTVNRKVKDTGTHGFSITMGMNYNEYSSDSYEDVKLYLDQARRDLTDNLPISITSIIEYETSVNGSQRSFLILFDIETEGE